MLKKNTIQDKIKHNAALIRELGISKINLFGSYASQKQTAGSDINILVDFQEGNACATFAKNVDLSPALQVLKPQNKA